MYVPTDNDNTYVLWVWARSPWLCDKLLKVHVTRRTYAEAVRYVWSLGYLLADVQ